MPNALFKPIFLIVFLLSIPSQESLFGQLDFQKGCVFQYFKGKDGDGNPIKGGEVYVDLDNLIDYMLVIFYTANFDSPTATFGSNKGPNNFYAINSSKDLSKGFTFYAHDAEHSMFAEEVPPGLGLNEDRVNLTRCSDDLQSKGSHQTSFSEVEDYSKLVMTELHYHPPGLPVDGDTISGKDLEFIELKNTGDVAINLSGLFLDSAVTYEFPEHTLLAPGQFYVIASKPSAFYLR